MLSRRLLALATSLLSTSGVFGIPWNATEYMFVFGDSYTADGYNVSAGVDPPVPGHTSSNGPNWVQFLTSTYNQTALKTFDLAYGGATIDAALVPPYTPTVSSIVDQVSQFDRYLATKPAGATWNSTNSLFAIWIGINDVGASSGWTDITQSEFYGVLMDRLFSQVANLYRNGARNFLFLTVPPTNRSPLVIAQGPKSVALIGTDIAAYNDQLTHRVRDFHANHTD
ncbi:carbohydrate esterase family 16 protein, partial [Paxillus rubicundulus Ve08.2h10]